MKEDEESRGIDIEREVSDGVVVSEGTIVYTIKPFDAFEHNIQKAEDLLNGEFFDVSLVMSIAAVESYFRRELEEYNEVVKFLIEEHRVSCQQLEFMKEIFKTAFDVKLPELNPLSWEALRKYSRIRNSIIHNAGRDKQNEKIYVGIDEAKECIECARVIVTEANKQIPR